MGLTLKALVKLSFLFVHFGYLESQSSKDKYIITSGQTSNDLYFYHGDVTTLSQTASSVKPTVLDLNGGQKMIFNLETNPSNSTVYFLDLVSSCVYGVSNFTASSASVSKRHCGISRSIGSTIAYDWVAENMYWSDGIFQWIAVQPLETDDKYMYRIIIQRDVADIAALAVDPIKRFLFWYDESPSGGRIERASLDGQDRKAIVTEGIIFISDIVADVTSQTLFWVDYNRYTIESTNYEGFQRRVVYKDKNNFFRSLAVDEDVVCGTIPKFNFWVCVDKNTGEYKYHRKEDIRKPYGIAIFNRATQPEGKTNFCAVAACEHFCVNGDTSHICMCKEGYTLDQGDKKSCKATHFLYGNGILVAFEQTMCMLEFRSITQGSKSGIRCFNTDLHRVKFLSVDATGYEVFYFETMQKEIKSFDISKNISKVIQRSTGDVSGLSFDWTQRKLYWSELNTGIIGRASVVTCVGEVFVDSENSINDVKVDPHNRIVFWIENKIRIVSSHMDDGKRQRVLTENGIKSALFFDVKSSRLYWTQDTEIRSIKADGTDLKSHKSGKLSDQLIIYKSYFIWISGEHTLKTLPMTTDHDIVRSITLPDYGTITGIATFDAHSQLPERGACDVNNGGCSHICVVTNNGRICKCKFGYTLQVDGTSCRTEPLDRDFILATDLTHGRIYQVSLLSGAVKTLDLPLVRRPVTAIYDSVGQFLYWTEANQGKIFKSRLNGKDTTIVYSSELGTYPERIVLDHTNGCLYFTVTDSTSSNKGYIGVIDTSTLYMKTLVTKLRYVFGLALYPSKGILFFTNDVGNSTNIFRSPMDGSFKNIIYTTTFTIFDLKIDYKTDRLYWSMSNKLLSCDLNGNNQEIITTAKLDIECFLLVSPYIFYSSNDEQKIIKFDVKKKQVVTWMTSSPEIGILKSLEVHPKEKTPVNSLCAERNGLCSTFCLPRESSKVCSCQNGVTLLSDGLSCKGVTKCLERVTSGSLENVCQSYAGETCSFTCNPGHTSEVHPQTLTCQANGTWDRQPSGLCSATRKVNTLPILAGGICGGIAIISLTVLCVLCRRRKTKKQPSHANVYYTVQSRQQPRISLRTIGEAPPSYAESVNTKKYFQEFVPHLNATENQYTTPPSRPPVEQDHVYEEIPANLSRSANDNQSNNGRQSFADGGYMESLYTRYYRN